MTPYYTEPGIEIWHGDCRDILPGLGAVDLVFTDPIVIDLFRCLWHNSQRVNGKGTR